MLYMHIHMFSMYMYLILQLNNTFFKMYQMYQKCISNDVET